MEQDQRILPYFPLGVFLFPGEDIPLRIFEPRYKQLIEDVRTSAGTFAIPYVIDRRIQDYGCEVELKEVVAENPAGRMVITVQSVALVKVNSFSKQLGRKLYAGGAVEQFSCSDPVESRELMELIRHYREDFDLDFPGCCEQGKITRLDVMKALNLS